jgi:uncharacterized membrane protein YidH (DUF202 family)
MLHLMTRFADTACRTIQGDNFCTDLPKGGASSANLQNLLQIVIATLAAIAVLIIVIASLNFVTSSSDPQKVAKARSTIVYALVGLVIAISAEAIVTFALGKVR